MANKVMIVGTGNVGMSYGYALIHQRTSVNELVLVDINEEDAAGEAIDLHDTLAVSPSYLKLSAGTYADAVPLAMSTGELEADLVYFQGGDQTCANLGKLEDLTEYVANSKYAQYIMSDYNKARTANYPYLLWLSWSTTYIPSMRTDHLQAIGMLDTLKADPSVENYHTALKTQAYTGIGEHKHPVIENMGAVMDHLRAAERVLVVDDIFDSGDTVAAVREAFRPFVKDLRFATLYYKPARSRWPFKPEFFLKETDAWLVFPHELVGLTPDEVRQKDPEVAKLLGLS